MPIIYTPVEKHKCEPGWHTPAHGLKREPNTEAYPVGTVWQCDECRQTWVCNRSHYVMTVSIVKFRKERWYERWYREKFKML